MDKQEKFGGLEATGVWLDEQADVDPILVKIGRKTREESLKEQRLLTAFQFVIFGLLGLGFLLGFVLKAASASFCFIIAFLGYLWINRDRENAFFALLFLLACIAFGGGIASMIKIWMV